MSDGTSFQLRMKPAICGKLNLGNVTATKPLFVLAFEVNYARRIFNGPGETSAEMCQDSWRMLDSTAWYRCDQERGVICLSCAHPDIFDLHLLISELRFRLRRLEQSCLDCLALPLLRWS